MNGWRDDWYEAIEPTEEEWLADQELREYLAWVEVCQLLEEEGEPAACRAAVRERPVAVDDVTAGPRPMLEVVVLGWTERGELAAVLVRPGWQGGAS
jgi:hypothetical protein